MAHQGVTKVKHLMDNNGNFLSLLAFENKYALKARPLAFYGLISAVKLLKRYIPPNTRLPLKYEFFLARLRKYKTKQTSVQETSNKKG